MEKMLEIDGYRLREECVEVRMHLTDCDGDGYCNFCGEQE